MPFNRNHVRAFLAKAEIDLFESSLGADLQALTAADVRRRIERTRKLRTKYRDLLQRQKLATRDRTASKAGASGDANERTAKKAKAFDETLARFEARARHLGAAGQEEEVKSKGTAKAGPTASRKSAAGKQPTRQAATNRLVPAAVTLRKVLKEKRAARATALATQPSRSRKAPASAAAAIGSMGATPPDVRATIVASRLDQSGLKRIQGHTGTQVRRAQAKRDHRG